MTRPPDIDPARWDALLRLSLTSPFAQAALTLIADGRAPVDVLAEVAVALIEDRERLVALVTECAERHAFSGLVVTQ